MSNFYVKFWTDRPVDRKSDRWTPVKQYALHLLMRVHKKLSFENIVEKEENPGNQRKVFLNILYMLMISYSLASSVR